VSSKSTSGKWKNLARFFSWSITSGLPVIHNGGKHGFQAPDQEFQSAAAGSFARNSFAVVTSGRSGSAFFQSVRNC